MSDGTVINPTLIGNSAKTEVNPELIDNGAKTAVNPTLIESSAETAINPELTEGGTETESKPAIAESVTRINPILSETVQDDFTIGSVLGGEYTLCERLKVNAGEADIYICVCEGKHYAAKIYRHSRAPKAEVSEALDKISSPYIVKPLKTGFEGGRAYEIIPYFKNGSLRERKFSLQELVDLIIPNVNSGLKALHSVGIIHKDLKPSNVMLGDDGKSIAILDFGISSLNINENGVIVTTTGMTPEYSAPETFKDLYLEESDYYSFGIMLYELYTGNTPYKNMRDEDIAKYVSIQKIPFPPEMPKRLKELIAGLTYYDITNRNEKHNPNRRWTYNEVQKWLSGASQPIPGAVQNEMIPYVFCDIEYKEVPAFAAALADRWEEGKKLLFSGNLSGFFRSCNPVCAAACLDAEEAAKQSGKSDDIVYFRFLYSLCNELKAFYWRGKKYETLTALGREMLDKLHVGDKSDYKYYNSVLKDRLLTEYVTIHSPDNAEMLKAVDDLETAYKFSEKTQREYEKMYYLLGYMLSGQKMLCIGEEQFKTVEELAEYMRSLWKTDFKAFERFCHILIQHDEKLNAQFESWLIAIGKSSAYILGTESEPA